MTQKLQKNPGVNVKKKNPYYANDTKTHITQMLQ